VGVGRRGVEGGRERLLEIIMDTVLLSLWGRGRGMIREGNPRDGDLLADGTAGCRRAVP